MPDPSGRTQITIAVIGLAGVLAAAVIANWRTLFPGHPTTTATQVPAQTMAGPNKPEDHSEGVVLYFQTANQSGGTVYYPNSPPYRTAHLPQLSDHHYLYFAGCDLLPQAQAEKEECGATNNWKKVILQTIGCTSVESCNERNTSFQTFSKMP